MSVRAGRHERKQLAFGVVYETSSEERINKNGSRIDEFCSKEILREIGTLAHYQCARTPLSHGHKSEERPPRDELA